MKNILTDALKNVKTVAIAGHTRPDGDCIGSCMGLYHYIHNHYPQIDVDVHLEEIPENFKMIKDIEQIDSTYQKEINYDLFIALDTSDLERLAGAVKYFKTAKQTLNIDHHISNSSFADHNHILPKASSTCEVLYQLLDPNLITVDIAMSLYIGIICDTGCFKHNNTSELTMTIAGRLIDTGFNFSRITDEVFYEKTMMQNQLLGRCLLEASLSNDRKIIFCFVTKEILSEFMATSKDLEGVVDQLRITKGVEVAVLATATDDDAYKISLRSNGKVNVNEIAKQYGGGGHILASGCKTNKTIYELRIELTKLVKEQLTNDD